MGKLSKRTLRAFGITDEATLATLVEADWSPGEFVRDLPTDRDPRLPTDDELQRRADRADLMRRVTEARCRFRRLA